MFQSSGGCAQAKGTDNGDDNGVDGTGSCAHTRRSDPAVDEQRDHLLSLVCNRTIVCAEEVCELISLVRTVSESFITLSFILRLCKL